jgi:hypothetical protein
MSRRRATRPIATSSRPSWSSAWRADLHPSLAATKDAVEDFFNREVCRGTIQLVDAQRMIATDWLAVYRSRGLQPAP